MYTLEYKQTSHTKAYCLIQANKAEYLKLARFDSKSLNKWKHQFQAISGFEIHMRISESVYNEFLVNFYFIAGLKYKIRSLFASTFWETVWHKGIQ